MRTARFLLPVLLVGLAWLPLLESRSASAHPHKRPPPLSYDLTIRDDSVLVVLIAEVAIIELWQGKPWVHPEDDDKPKALAEFVDLLDAHVTLEIDGVVRRDGVGDALVVLEAFPIPGQPTVEDQLMVKIRYPVDRAPAQVELTWDDFTGCVWEGEVQVPSLIEAGYDVDVGLVSPTEPTYTWWPYTESPDWSDDVEAPSLPLVVTRDVALRTLASTLALQGGLPSVVAVAVDARPPARLPPAPELPTRAEAQALFESAQATIYRAFDAGSVPEAQTALARVARPGLVGPLLAEVRELMTIRPLGGVRGHFDRAETKTVEVDVPADAQVPHFLVAWYGAIHVAAEHFGHRHQRAMAMDTRYLFTWDGAAWRLRALQVLDMRMLEEDEEGNLPKDEDDGGWR